MSSPSRRTEADARQHSPSVARNRQALLDVFRSVLPPSGRVLEVGSGSGEHAVFVAGSMRDLTWMPSDVDPQARTSIAAWIASAGLANVLPPLALDVERRPWAIEKDITIDAVISINMIHISPFSTAQNLVAGAAELLRRDGLLLLYGPFKRNGEHTAPSNAEFDLWLKNRDPRFGVRDLSDIEREATASGLTLTKVIEMPANNLSVIFARESASGTRDESD